MHAKTRSTQGFKTVRQSLGDLVGQDAVDAAVTACVTLAGVNRRDLKQRASRRIDLFPRAMQRRLGEWLSAVGTQVMSPVSSSASGATSTAFASASSADKAPVAGFGYYRLGEDGVLRFISKSEHYHAPLGHAFPGFSLLETARALGLCNATHNNTRGHVTRRLEEALVRRANGLDDAGPVPARIANSARPAILNRVLNLETGSLAAEAAIKMMLARFYRVEPGMRRPAHGGKIPVFVVMGDDDGRLIGNYHGTTIIAQAMRGMWPELETKFSQNDLFKFVTVRPNDRQGLDAAFRRWHRGRYRIAGFLHEIVMMNYGAVLLSRAFLRHAYRLAREHDVPVLVDEIQTGIWSPELFMFREYGLKPQFVALGKGFPGGEYPASRLLFSAAYDVLPLFGALVTNGQEELASLAYLITMRWATENAAVTRAVGDRYEAGLRDLARRHSRVIDRVEGCRHCSALYFRTMVDAKAFVAQMQSNGFDISVQAYKADCPPSALTKIPLIAGHDAVAMILDRMAQVIETL